MQREGKMSKHFIAVVGAGRLGSRHLEALASVPQHLNIFVVDPSANALKAAEEIFRSAKKNNHEVTYCTNWTQVPKEKFDLVINATTSRYRLKTLQEMYERITPKFMIMEKILFAKIPDYETGLKLVQKHGTKTWVNCPMRIIPHYEFLKEHGDGPVSIDIVGGNTRSGSNLIHFFDYITYLSGTTDYELDVHPVGLRFLESKRESYLEFEGSFLARYPDGSRLAFYNHLDPSYPTTIHVSIPQATMIARDKEMKAWRATKKGDWKWEEISYKYPMQSTMTTALTIEILETGNCALTSLEESIKVHMPMMKAFVKLGKDTNKWGDEILVT